MKSQPVLLCRHRLFTALFPAVGLAWALAEATQPAVGIAIGAGLAFSLLHRDRQP